MSLINQVLKDLDARQAVESARHPLPSAVRPLPPLPTARRRWLLVAAIVLAVGGMLLLAWRFLPWPTPTADVVPAVTPPPALAVKAAAPSLVPPPAPGATLIEATTVAVLPPADSAAIAPAEAPVAVHDAPPAITPSAATPAVAKKASVVKAPAVVTAGKGEAARPLPQVAEADAPPARPAGASAAKNGAIERSDAAMGAGGRAEADYRKAIDALNLGRVAEAIDGLRGVLRTDPLQRAARQLLVKLLLEAGRHDEAAVALREGLQGQPAQIGWAMALARLQVERGDLAGAWTTLDASLPAASGSADYQGFAGNVLQRLGRSREAIARFAAATRLAPADGRWWLGLGLAHDVEGNVDEARAAWLNARLCTNLSPELLALIEQKLR